MNSCYELWKQMRKTGPVHWEGRGDIEWCVCDICAHTCTHTYAERVTSVSPITSFTRATLCNISPSSNLPLSSPLILFGFIPIPWQTGAIYSQHAWFRKENSLALLGRLSNTTFCLNDQKRWVITWTLRVWSVERWGRVNCFWSCFGSVTYQLGKTLMVDSFTWLLSHLIPHSSHPSRAAFVPPFQSCLWFSKVQCWVFLYTITAWRTCVSSLNRTYRTSTSCHDFSSSPDYAGGRLRISRYWIFNIYEIQRVNALRTSNWFWLLSFGTKVIMLTSLRHKHKDI